MLILILILRYVLNVSGLKLSYKVMISLLYYLHTVPKGEVHIRSICVDYILLVVYLNCIDLVP